MIVSFAYEDLDAGWTLEEVRFDALNLLVGPSGAGKTRILEALLNVRRAALRGAGLLPSARWRLEVEGVDRVHEDDVAKFIWEAETKMTGVVGDVDPWFGDRNGHFVSERIKGSGRLLVGRTDEEFKFDDKRLPKLTKWESAVGLLASEEALSPLYEALRLLRDLKIFYSARSFQTLESAEESRQLLGGRLDLLRRDDSLHPFTKLYVLQQDHPELFGHIADDFVDIFPTVEALKVATYSELGVREDSLANHLAVGMQEEGVEGWVLHSALSSGMVKTLLFLIATALAPRGMVLLIDEIENSLGVNCLPDVARRMLKGLDRVQYIATSHHPRVINEIPFDSWKLVTRRGSKVRVVNAGDIASLERASSLEKFTELINLPEYAEGVA
jgi:AAA domain, putative AbiEii toxin, Type IV TA system